MNVFIILSILIIVIGVLLLVSSPSVLFKLNWKEKTGKEKILMFMFYSILVYIINIIYWIIKWVRRSFVHGAYIVTLNLRRNTEKNGIIRKKGELMNVFIILSILVIVIGVLLLVATPSVLFKLNWKEKTGKEKILMFIFYSILVYIINIIYWIIKWKNF